MDDNNISRGIPYISPCTEYFSFNNFSRKLQLAVLSLKDLDIVIFLTKMISISSRNSFYRDFKAKLLITFFIVKVILFFHVNLYTKILKYILIKAYIFSELSKYLFLLKKLVFIIIHHVFTSSFSYLYIIIATNYNFVLFIV